MDTLVAQLEKEKEVQVLKHEVWHNKENEKKLESFDRGLCGGVPFFFNTKTKKFICGEATYEELEAWSKSE
jgi:hypothetical protein